MLLNSWIVWHLGGLRLVLVDLVHGGAARRLVVRGRIDQVPGEDLVGVRLRVHWIVHLREVPCGLLLNGEVVVRLILHEDWVDPQISLIKAGILILSILRIAPTPLRAPSHLHDVPSRLRHGVLIECALPHIVLVSAEILFIWPSFGDILGDVHSLLDAPALRGRL